MADETTDAAAAETPPPEGEEPPPGADVPSPPGDAPPPEGEAAAADVPPLKRLINWMKNFGSR